MNRKLITLAAAASLALPGLALAQTSTTGQTGATQNGAASTATPAPDANSPSTAPANTMAPATTKAPDSVPAATATPADAAGYATVPPDARLSSAIVGLSVTNPQNQDVATIKDVAYGASGQVIAYILGYGGFLGIGGHYVAVQPSALMLHWDAPNKQWKAQMNTTADALKGAPQYTYPNQG